MRQHGGRVAELSLRYGDGLSVQACCHLELLCLAGVSVSTSNHSACIVPSAWKAVFPSAFLASAWHLTSKEHRHAPPPRSSTEQAFRRQRIGCLRIGFGFTCGAGRGPTGTGHGHWTGDLRQWKNPAFCSHLAGEHVWEPLMTLPVNRPCPSGGSHSLEQRSPPCGGQLEISTGETIARSETILTSPTCNWWAPFGAFWGELRQKKGFVSEAVHN